MSVDKSGNEVSINIVNVKDDNEEHTPVLPTTHTNETLEMEIQKSEQSDKPIVEAVIDAV